MDKTGWIPLNLVLEITAIREDFPLDPDLGSPAIFPGTKKPLLLLQKRHFTYFVNLAGLEPATS